MIKYNKNPYLRKHYFLSVTTRESENKTLFFVVTEKSQGRSGHVFSNLRKLKIFENKNKKTIQTEVIMCDN